MSTLYVDNLQPNLGNATKLKGAIVHNEVVSVGAIAANLSANTWQTAFTHSYTPKFADSVLSISVSPIAPNNASAANSKTWMEIRVDSTSITEVANQSRSYSQSESHAYGQYQLTSSSPVTITLRYYSQDTGYIYFSGSRCKMYIQEIAQ